MKSWAMLPHRVFDNLYTGLLTEFFLQCGAPASGIVDGHADN